MKLALIVDCETSSLDPSTGHLLELGMVRWSIEHRTVFACSSQIVRAPSNEAESVNGIPFAALAHGIDRSAVDRAFRMWSESADVILAHGDFDAKWLPAVDKPWVDTCNDLVYPKPSTSRALTALCLAHGIGVTHAHRALPDCLLVAQLLERCAELGADVHAMLERGLRPKAKFAVAESGFDPARNELAKKHLFRWVPESKLWMRTMARDDIAALPFAVREVQP